MAFVAFIETQNGLVWTEIRFQKCLIEAIVISHQRFQLIYFSIQDQRNYIHFLKSYAALVEVILSSLKQIHKSHKAVEHEE